MSTYLPAKDYDVTIEEVNLVESKTKGTKGLEFRLSSECGIIYHSLWITPLTKPKVVEILAEFSLTADDLKTAEFWSDPGAKLAGMPARITTEAHEYNGKTSVRVQWFHGTAGRAVKKASPETAALLAEMFNDGASVPF